MPRPLATPPLEAPRLEAPRLAARPLARSRFRGHAASLVLLAALGAPAGAQGIDANVAGTNATGTNAAETSAAGTSPAKPMEFSPALSGAWEGSGEVLVNMGQQTPFTVKCDLTVDASDTTFALDGECGALFVKRPIKVSLTREGETITGTYDAELRTGQATLEGAETDGAIEMEITWGGEVNGDTTADMRIVRDGEDGLRIVFTDTDPATGETRTTSDLVLERA